MSKANSPILIALLPLALASAAYADEAPPQAVSSSQNPSEKVVVTGTRAGEQDYRVPTVDSIEIGRAHV